MQAKQQIDMLDKKLLNEIQWTFPLIDRPYLEISKHHNISEDEIMQRIAYIKDFVRELQKDLKVIPEPFRELAGNLGITTTELFTKAKEYEQIGVMRRFAAILRHRNAGFSANGMIVWKVPEDKIDEVGYKLASFPQVSHCYRRPVYPDWQFNLFSMIHARTIEAAKKIAIELS